MKSQRTHLENAFTVVMIMPDDVKMCVCVYEGNVTVPFASVLTNSTVEELWY
jgi:hypothetical protein